MQDNEKIEGFTQSSSAFALMLAELSCINGWSPGANPGMTERRGPLAYSRQWAGGSRSTKIGFLMLCFYMFL